MARDALSQTQQSPLKMQTRSIACFPTATGYAIGSIEGRIGIQCVADGCRRPARTVHLTLESPPRRNTEDKDSAQNFSFKCHRQEPASSSQSRLVQPAGQESQIYSVNAISFNRLHGTFSTAGADGTVSFWGQGPANAAEE